MQAECDAVIQGQGLPPGWRQGLQQPDQGFGRGRGLPALQGRGEDESGFSFHPGQDSASAMPSDAGIPLPVSVAGPFLHAGWPLFDADAVGDQGAYGSLGAPVPSLPGLSRIGAHDGFPSRVFVNEPVHGFCAYPHAGITGTIDP